MEIKMEAIMLGIIFFTLGIISLYSFFIEPSIITLWFGLASSGAGILGIVIGLYDNRGDDYGKK